jgi:hypothetical protein
MCFTDAKKKEIMSDHGIAKVCASRKFVDRKLHPLLTQLLSFILFDEGQ